MADAAAAAGQQDVSEMERMLRAMLARQLVSVIEAAGSISATRYLYSPVEGGAR